MARRDPAASPPAFLGDELRRARLAAGYSSQEALAGKLGFDRTVVAEAETGERPPTQDVLEAWAVACNLDPGLFARQAGLARSANGPVPSWFQDWLEADRDAMTLRLWSPILVPGFCKRPATPGSCSLRRVKIWTELTSSFRPGWRGRRSLTARIRPTS